MPERDWPRMIWTTFIACASLAMIALVLPSITLGWRDRGWTGFRLDRTTGAILNVESNSPASRAGLAPGDTILASSLAPGDAIRLAAPPPETRFHFEVRRGGATRQIVVAAERAPSAYPPLVRVLLVTEILAFVAFVVIGGLLAALRPGAMTFWLFVFCLGTAPLDALVPTYAGLPTLPLVAGYVWARTFLGGFSALPLLPFVLRFPSDSATGWRARWYGPAVAAFVIGAAGYFALAVSIATSFVPHWRLMNDIPALGAFAAGVAVLIAGLLERRGVERERFRWAALGSSVGFAALLLDYVPNVSPAAYPAANSVAVIMPIAIGYAVFRQRLIDVRFFVNRAAVYGTITFGLLVIIGLAEFLISRIVDEQHLLAYLTAAVSVAVGAVFNRVHERGEAFVERLIFRARFRAEERLGVTARGLRFAQSSEAIDDALTASAVQEMRLRGAAVFRRTEGGAAYACVARAGAEEHPSCVPADGTLVRNLRSELRTLAREGRGGFAIPILSGQDLTGFALYGPHRDGAEIDPVEVRILEALAAAAAIAYANVEAAACRREVDDLRARVALLEAARTARARRAT